MAVPYTFGNIVGGSNIPLAYLDADFAYITNGTSLNPTIMGYLTLTGNLRVDGNSTFIGPVTTNDLAVNGVLTVDGQSINPTGVTGTGLWVFNTGPTLVAPIQIGRAHV